MCAALFPARPRPAVGEAAAAYLLRVASANGLHSQSQLRCRAETLRASPFEALLAGLQLSAEEVRRLSGVLPKAWGWNGRCNGLSDIDFNPIYRRWCSDCLAAETVWKGVWTLKLCCACPLHGCWLKDTCDACGAMQSWRSIRTRCGSCNADMLGGNRELAPSMIVELTAMLSAAECTSPTHVLPAMLDQAAAHRMVRGIGGLLVNDNRRTGQLPGLHRLAEARSLVEATAGLFLDWPTHFDQWLTRLRDAHPSALGVRQAFDPLYSLMYRRLKAPCFQYLREEFERYLFDNWWGTVCRRNGRISDQARVAHPRVPMSKAASRSGVAPALMKQLVQADLIPAAEVMTPSGKTVATLHLESLKHAKLLAANTMTLREVATCLHLTRDRIRQLVCAGILKPVVPTTVRAGVGRWHFSRTSAEGLFVPSGINGKPLAEVLRGLALSDDRAIELIAHVLQRRDGKSAAPLSMVPLGQALVSAQEMAEWASHPSRRVAGLFSVVEAAHLLGLKQEVTYGLIEAGLLDAEAFGNGRVVSSASIARFQALYVPLAALARTSRTSPKSLLGRIQARPATGPTIDGARQYFFYRADVEPILPTADGSIALKQPSLHMV